ncbi:MAG: D-alanine--D-alanine ligase A [Micrococcales bacterium]|nr:MAG: D-alanine--D-alanine ligase A [Micrococcales bacterium]
MQKRTRVAVIFGGRSSEHAISCITGAAVMRALDPHRYEVVPVGVTPEGSWLAVEADPRRWELHGDGPLPQVSATDGQQLALPSTTEEPNLTILTAGEVPRALGAVDVVFPVLHGPYGEDGTLQGMLELADIRYVGAGVLSSAVSMDKHYMKLVLAGNGIPTGPYTVVLPGQWDRDPDEVRARVEPLGLPVFVKPARAGSSMGVSKVETTDQLGPAIIEATGHDPKVIVEAAVTGREIECGVLEDLDAGPPRTSPPGEVEVLDGAHSFYDFSAKYLDEDSVRLTCPADLSARVTERVQQLARATFTAVGCEGLARVDCFVTGDEQVVVNEINTMPGFTPFSMFPRMWQAAGVPYGELVDTLVHLAMRRRVGLR